MSKSAKALLIILILLVAGSLGYAYLMRQQAAPAPAANTNETANAPATNSPVTMPALNRPTSGLPPTCKNDGGDPVITAVSPSIGPVGIKINIIGCNFSGFEGDKNAWLVAAGGTKAILYGETGSTDELIKTTLKQNLCQEDVSYKGGPCQKPFTLKPGAYSIHVEPWGKVSNAAPFTVQ